MPYIEKNKRTNLDESILNLCSSIKNKNDDFSAEQLLDISGDINYCLSRVCANLMGKTSYKKIAIITGVLENIKQEFYRRIAQPYEDKKIEENGDVMEYKNV